MGLAMGRLLGLSYSLTKQLQARILMLGLDAAGKTTILYKLKTGEVASTIATVAFNIERIEYRNISFTFWDVGGHAPVYITMLSTPSAYRDCLVLADNRPLWKYYFHDTQGLVFVVDSNDRDRIRLARDELNTLLNAEELRDAALLVLANQQDLPNAMSTAEMSEELGLHQSLGNRRWHIQSACATSGEGLYEGVDWLCTNVDIKIGRLLSLSYRLLVREEEARILMLGLDAAGKTIHHPLQAQDRRARSSPPSQPFIGFNVETFEYKNISFTVWDVGGQGPKARSKLIIGGHVRVQLRIRPLWKHYFHGTQGLIFVVDSSDRERILQVRDELYMLLNEEELRDATLLVFANKQDLPNAMTTAAEMAAEELGLGSLHPTRRWWSLRQ
ncbi:uncharacterized protein C2845_PM02G41030 [Panicum miliaceum]|uniref:Uncharacterized protein n=1 Tax=Panicum miliaceum TaxID=4540 RepID=A0A3L6S851_PANMI|nr:uncharacterized protein C2845_PM02G41030 [Panicum miliaceum]